MNDEQEDKLSMYQAVQGNLQANSAIWQPIAAFVNAESAFNAEVATIESLGQAQQQPSTGVTQNKTQARAAMADAAFEIASALCALAEVIEDNDLAAQADYTLSDFIYGRDTAAADKADIVHGLATTHAAALANYGIDQARIDALRTAIDAYRALIAAPRNVITTTAAATAQLEAAFPRADKILKKQLDKLIVLFRTSQPAFYLSYQNARQIVNTGGGSPPPPPSPPPPSPPPP